MTAAYGHAGEIARDLALLLVTGGVVAWLWRSRQKTSDLPTSVPTKAQSGLHWLRGLMALLVLVEHVRSLLFVRYVELEHPSLLTQGFYFVTAWGSQAVIVFFVLSGYLITRLYARALTTGEMGWASFALNRAVRLYLVLVPALVLTWALGALSSSTDDEPGLTFVGHLLFLQPVHGDLFKNNPPLWSLGFEGMAYLAFASAAVGVRYLRQPSAAKIGRVLPWLLVAGVCIFFGSWFWHYMSLWLLGAAAALFQGSAFVKRSLSPTAGKWALAACISLLTGSFVITRFGAALVVQDWLVAASAALCIALFHHARGSEKATQDHRSVGEMLSRRAYSVYVLHYPLLALLATQLGSSKGHPSFYGLLGALATCLCVIVLSGGFAQVTEAQTSRVRRLLSRRTRATIDPTSPTPGAR